MGLTHWASLFRKNSWSVAWTNASLLNISLWLTGQPFSQDGDIVTKKGLYGGEFTMRLLCYDRGSTGWHFDVLFWFWRSCNSFPFPFPGAVFLQDLGRMNADEKTCELQTQRLHSCLIFLFIVSALCRLNKVTRADSWQVFWSSTLN